MFWSPVPDHASEDEMVAPTIPPVMSLLLHATAAHLICHTSCATVSNDKETMAPTFHCFCHITVMSRLCHLRHITTTSRGVAHPLVTLPSSKRLQKQQDTHHPPLLPWHDNEQGSCASFSTYDADWLLMSAEPSCMLTSYYQPCHHPWFTTITWSVVTIGWSTVLTMAMSPLTTPTDCSCLPSLCAWYNNTTTHVLD